MVNRFKAFWKDEEGTTTMQYAMVIALVVIVAFMVSLSMDVNIKTVFSGNIPPAV